MNKKPLMLMILDGWGISACPSCVNAIKNANPQEFSNLILNYPNSKLEASGEAVGLPVGQMGNSEVGHLNIGAGRVIYQPLVKISKDILSEEFFKKENLIKAFTIAKEKNVSLHFGGLVSDGGVHSHIKHIFGLLEMAKKYDLKKVFIHAFLDGRDTPPSSGVKYLQLLEDKMKELGVGKIATISGRYFAMDRDKNWDRTKKAYDAMTVVKPSSFNSAKEAILSSYSNNITDEFFEPTVIDEDGIIKEHDIFINFNFRPDRARQITRSLNDLEFTHFERTIKPVTVFCMRQYDSTIEAPIIYKDPEIINTLGEVVSNAGLKQFRTAETEKYAHVTFFFNGGVEDEFKGEDRILVPSPQSVRTYDEKPSMSIYEVTEKLTEAIKSDKYKLIVLNYANGDMVGHTGIYEAAIEAIESIDDCLSKIVPIAIEHNYAMTIAADHGNSEEMWNYDANAPHTQHTTGVVPLIIVNAPEVKSVKSGGALKDLSPTMLDLLNIEKPKAMTGESLAVK